MCSCGLQCYHCATGDTATLHDEGGMDSLWGDEPPVPSEHCHDPFSISANDIPIIDCPYGVCMVRPESIPLCC